MARDLARDITEAGPVDGVDLLYNAVRTGAITRIEFTECVAAIVAQTVMGLEDMEDDAVVMAAVIADDRIAAC